jgi:hypothetical protein
MRVVFTRAARSCGNRSVGTRSPSSGGRRHLVACHFVGTSRRGTSSLRARGDVRSRPPAVRRSRQTESRGNRGRLLPNEQQVQPDDQHERDDAEPEPRILTARAVRPSHGRDPAGGRRPPHTPRPSRRPTSHDHEIPTTRRENPRLRDD